MEKVLDWSQITPQQHSIFIDNRLMAKMSLREQGCPKNHSRPKLSLKYQVRENLGRSPHTMHIHFS